MRCLLMSAPLFDLYFPYKHSTARAPATATAAYWCLSNSQSFKDQTSWSLDHFQQTQLSGAVGESGTKSGREKAEERRRQALVSGHRSGDGKCFSNLFPCFTWPTSSANLARDLAASFSFSLVFRAIKLSYLRFVWSKFLPESVSLLTTYTWENYEKYIIIGYILYFIHL